MRLSLSITNFSWRDGGLANRLCEIAQAADRGGLDGVWVADHLLQADPYGARPGETEMLEAYTTLGFLAARTERVRLGTMVTGVTLRAPGPASPARTRPRRRRHHRAVDRRRCRHPRRGRAGAGPAGGRLRGAGL